MTFRGARCLASLLALAVAGCVPSGDRLPTHDEPDPRAEALSDPAYRAAAAALAERRPWRAESLLAPAMDDPARRTAWVVLLAAEMAGATGRWPRVDSLLGRAPLEDSRAEAEARLLLARGALERGDAEAALEHARVARGLASNANTHAQALVFLARAHERLGARDSALASYSGAATVLVPIGDWLILRATSLTRDSAARAKHYKRLRTTTARERAAYAEAQLLERTGRARAAIALYEQGGAPMQAMRLRAATASGLAERERVRRELVAFVQANTGTFDARHAIEMLDAGRYRLTAAEEIIVARSAARHGPLSRARSGLARAFTLRAPTVEERLFQVSVLAESGPASRREAERLLTRIRKPSPAAGVAALERAKLIRRRGATAAARTALRQVVREFPDDTAAASGALLILAEMATDALRDTEARDAYRTLAMNYPTSEHAPRARFHAAVLAFAAGRHRVAAEELDLLAELHPTSADGPGALYWSARARAALRDTAGARERWEALLASAPMSYYAAQGARRLGVAPWAPPASPDTFAMIGDVRDALTRIELLERLGMLLEARLELDALAASADSSAERVLAIADAFRARGQMRRAMELGRKAIALGAKDARAWRLVYPVGAAELVLAEATGRRVDPALVAAVIRHESSFEERATSPVGARGLMQVMPNVGRALARSEKITPWDPAMLYDPDINVRLGVIHLRSFTRHYSHETLALAAYNAGPGRVARWVTRPGGRDPELFVERIRFPETRGYVRNVLRSRDMYAALYDWGEGRGTD
ncbi:MAG TPA: transglycosylase SLT domain-containing protein [Gemmatimonadaceae bacterium]|nr:transglycosylase SLT domain-containing protein [Gemmatimonadaceae bacterium]